MKLLLQYGADPELRDEDGHTPLEKAQERGDEWHRQVIEILENPSMKGGREREGEGGRGEGDGQEGEGGKEKGEGRRGRRRKNGKEEREGGERKKRYSKEESGGMHEGEGMGEEQEQRGRRRVK